MLKTTFKATALFFALSLSANAAELRPAEVKNTYLKNCASVGGVSEVCQCSYNKALQVMTVADLATINSQMSTGISDGTLAARLERVTRECSAAVKVSRGEDPTLLPPAPPPPTDLQPIPDKSDPATAKNYMTEIKQPVKQPLPIDDTPTPGLSKNDQAKMDRASGLSADQAPIAPDDNIVAPKPPKNVKAVKTVKTPKSDETEVAEPVKKGKNHKSVYGQYDRMFFDAAARGDIEALRAYATKVSDFDVRNENGDTALIVAISFGKEASVNYLISRKVDVNLKNLKGQSPLHIAAFISRPDIVETLLQARANPNVLYGAGYTPLVLATMQQDTATIKVLLQGKAKVNQPLLEGNTELHVAAVGANPEIISLLAQAGGKIDQKNKAGYTPLMVAAYSGNANGVAAFLQAGANPNLKDKAGRTPAVLAQAAGKQDAFNVLMSVQQQ